ncbi:MAG: hypothetical protein J1E59_01935 [Treponema sp.]|nr:hypothetical protein [Treponema sp.]
MKRSIIASIVAFLSIFSNSLFAQNSEDVTRKVQDYSAASVSVRFFDRTVYYPGNVDGNPIDVHITIRNSGSETLRFKLADDRMFSADFLAFTVQNTQLEQTDEIVEKRTKSHTVYFREIAIEPGEEYSFIENAKKYLKFDTPGVYYLEMRFYPELYKSKYLELKSNRLMLEMRPAPHAASSSIIPVKEDTAEILRPEAISPDKVVEQTIVARQKSLWDQFFLYIDLEAMFRSDPLRDRRFAAASAEDGERMLSDYKAELMSDRIDTDIVAVPERFEIKRTNYSQTEGTVTVHEWFKYQNFSEKKEYVYYVRQRDGIWRVYRYYVNNLGTE